MLTPLDGMATGIRRFHVCIGFDGSRLELLIGGNNNPARFFGTGIKRVRAGGYIFAVGSRTRHARFRPRPRGLLSCVVRARASVARAFPPSRTAPEPGVDLAFPEGPGQIFNGDLVLDMSGEADGSDAAMDTRT